jgi:fatty-acyl-CoA synthase
MIKAGLKKGDRAAILFFNSAYFAETYFASVKAGLIATPVSFRLAAPEILFILNNSQAKILFYDPEFETRLADMQEGLETVQFFVSPHHGDSSLSTAYEDFLSSGGGLASALPQGCEDDPCQLMYTSGTTGRPKGAILSHRNIIWNLFNTICGREDQPGEKAVIVGPLFHTAALNNHFTIQVALGGTSILMRKFDPETLLQTIEKEKATLMSGAPAIYNMLIQHPDAHRYDVGSITKCTAGADKLPMETKKRIMKFFPNIEGVYDVYGCTEASPCITILNARDSLRKDMSVGKALPFLEARVVDQDDRPLPP